MLNRLTLLATLAAGAALFTGCTESGGGSGDGAIGATCTDGGDCASGVCIALVTGPICSQDCAEAACPEGYACGTAGSGDRVCTPDPNAGPSGPDQGPGGGMGGAGGGAGGAGGGAGGAGGGAGGAGGGAGGAGGGAGGAGGGGGGDDLSCTGIFQCLERCQDQACAQGCIDDGSPAAQRQFNDIGACLQANRCLTPQGEVDQACAEANCGAEINACFGGGGGGGGGGGDLSCSGFLQCLSGCGPNDGACQQACRNDASAEGLAQYNAVVECAQTNNCFGADGTADQACLTANCDAEVTACLGSGPEPMGDDTCDQFNVCVNQCGANQACQEACVEAASPEAFRQYNDIISCGQQNQCFDAQGRADQACLTGACGAQLDACFGAQPEPMGDASCQETLDCVEACEDEACGTACIEAASPAGFQQAATLIQCLDANQCPAPDCPACSAEFTACQ